MVDGFVSTITAGGYGSLLSQGRRWSCETRREKAEVCDVVSRALRSMERLRNDALQTRDPGVWG